MAGLVPNDYVEKHMSDVEFSRWLHSNGWKGDYEHLEKTVNYGVTAYVVNGKTIAIVKIKNSYPCDRWLFFNPDI